VIGSIDDLEIPLKVLKLTFAYLPSLRRRHGIQRPNNVYPIVVFLAVTLDGNATQESPSAMMESLKSERCWMDLRACSPAAQKSLEMRQLTMMLRSGRDAMRCTFVFIYRSREHTAGAI
jgi:hypothetical protein